MNTLCLSPYRSWWLSFGPATATSLFSSRFAPESARSVQGGRDPKQPARTDLVGIWILHSLLRRSKFPPECQTMGRCGYVSPMRAFRSLGRLPQILLPRHERPWDAGDYSHKRPGVVKNVPSPILCLWEFLGQITSWHVNWISLWLVRCTFTWFPSSFS